VRAGDPYVRPMLLRGDDGSVLVIGQPSHAWVSGQLARAWGNATFGALDPWEEVCLAAEQHDIGMAAWDLEPTRNPETGLPHAFTEMPLDAHLECWRNGPRRLVRQSRYAALLCSIHGTRLYEMRDLDRMAPDDATAVRDHIAAQRAFQAELLGVLRADPVSARGTSEALVTRNSQLIWTWDFISLALCLDWAPCSAKAVPLASGESVELVLDPGPAARQLVLDPWPLGVPRLTVRAEGQRLHGPYTSDAALRAALATAPWETLEVELFPRGS
jgi:Protein of unknown function (DUF3891)